MVHIGYRLRFPKPYNSSVAPFFLTELNFLMEVLAFCLVSQL